MPRWDDVRGVPAAVGQLAGGLLAKGLLAKGQEARGGLRFDLSLCFVWFAGAGVLFAEFDLAHARAHSSWGCRLQVVEN